MIRQDYVRRVYGGWLGKCIGVRHGAPVEGWSAQDIAQVYEQIGQRSADFFQKFDIFEADDDINGPLFLMRAMENVDRYQEVTSADIALAWLQYPPFEHGFFWWPGYARPTAYHRLLAGDKPWEENDKRPDTGLGARIFIDGFALCCPGEPTLAKRIAGRALRVHIAQNGSGEDSAILQACLISLAFEENDVETLVVKALSYINQEGDIARMTRALLALYQQSPLDAQAAVALIDGEYAAPRFPGMFHAVPNMGYVLCGLLFSGGDFARAMEITTRCGLDTDCNSGSLGAIFGVMVGVDGIAQHLREQVRDIAVCSSVLGADNIGDIPTQAKRIACSGYQMLNSEPPKALLDAVRAPLKLDFSLGAEYHGIRARREGAPDRSAVFQTGQGGLSVYLPGLGASRSAFLEHRTYLHPKDVHNTRYDPAFSPKVYGGQTLEVEAALVKPLDNIRFCAAARLRDGRILRSEYSLATQSPAHLTLPLKGACAFVVEGVGLEIQNGGQFNSDVQVRLGGIHVHGEPDYCIDFSLEEVEKWDFFHCENSQSTYTRGAFSYTDGRLMADCVGHGEWLSGAGTFRDYGVYTTVYPKAGAACVLLRVQGAYRYYALEIVGTNARLTRTLSPWDMAVLATTPLKQAKAYDVGLWAKGNEVYATVGDAVLSAKDDLLKAGCFGVRVYDVKGGCARASFGMMCIKGEKEC